MQSCLKEQREENSPAQVVASAEAADHVVSQGSTFLGVLPNTKVVLQRGVRNSSEAGPVGFEPMVSEARVFSSEG